MWRWARDKRRYRFVQDTRYGRKVLAESNDIPEIVEAVTHYVARRIIERERALAEDESPLHDAPVSKRAGQPAAAARWRMLRAFLFGLIAGLRGAVRGALDRRVADAALGCLALREQRLAVRSR